MKKSPKIKDSSFKAAERHVPRCTGKWVLGQAVGAASAAPKEVSWGGQSRWPLARVNRRRGWSPLPDRGLN